ncbi:hypothetical protein EI427_01355 [Flammeovirga pectinis]|uniref:Uncharacterized protein n=1 Tax=Flammeovirga pectinis TaxID=2494373 RepID=A0A3S9NYI5_9BACT|nr:hypothetical protein [Flammeovirga pectinis]AZQ60906.1 hypothetical protein EI427_01355 [Flammeovirga pectinis]
MKSSIKSILVLVFTFSMFSCSTMLESENVVPYKASIPVAKQADNEFLKVYLQPTEAICNDVIVVEVELINSSGYKHTESITSVNGVVTFTHDHEFTGGGYSVYFRNISTNELFGSTSFYLTQSDLEKDTFSKTVIYNNCY